MILTRLYLQLSCSCQLYFCLLSSSQLPCPFFLQRMLKSRKGELFGISWTLTPAYSCLIAPTPSLFSLSQRSPFLQIHCDYLLFLVICLHPPRWACSLCLLSSPSTSRGLRKLLSSCPIKQPSEHLAYFPC